ncbi:type II toxin-antitoxin system RelE/ParE family toxin [uncultured Arcticibacterium sp.]|uniref:type II toxin-antitoxin system RelE/ParE family toxin n=1 Tax=uncultured Arcticibacterium sp. TaxID=2173042 RepID=UPI0030FCDACD
MAKRIIWSKRAKEDRSSILRYWLNRNKSNAYPRKLNKLFSESVRWLSESPFGRRRTDYLETNVKIVRDYKIIFEEDETTIFILTIWDTRQNPERLSSIIKDSKN